MIAAGQSPGRIHNNCSGKHAGMLAHCVQQQWVTNGYHRASHPMQQRVVSTLTRWMRINADEVVQGIDGCGLPTFAIALDAVAEGCANFSAAVADKDPSPSAIFDAMVTHPEFVAGTDSSRHRPDARRRTPARSRRSASEGFYCAVVPSMRLGIALKVEDGATRAAEPALLAVLRHVEAIGTPELSCLSQYASPDILNTRGEVVGSLRTRLEI